MKPAGHEFNNEKLLSYRNECLQVEFHENFNFPQWPWSWVNKIFGVKNTNKLIKKFCGPSRVHCKKTFGNRLRVSRSKIDYQKWQTIDKWPNIFIAAYWHKQFNLVCYIWSYKNKLNKITLFNASTFPDLH